MSDKIVSIRAAVVEKNSPLIVEQADIIIEAAKIVLRLTGMKHATFLAVDAETGVATHEIKITTLEQ